ncbi:hypothetical protein CR513_13555, partial [Mucuna pruriens]
MLRIFKENLVNAAKELNSPASLNLCTKPKLSHEIEKNFMSCNSLNAFSICLTTPDAPNDPSKPLMRGRDWELSLRNLKKRTT